MKKALTLKHRFVDAIPEKMEDRTLYISIEYATATHKCCCGCGLEVVTPLTPTDWKLIFDGETVSLTPSIGNWSFPCRSHYWIERNGVKWAAQMTEAQIRAVRSHDKNAKAAYFGATGDGANKATTEEMAPKATALGRVLDWLFGKK